MKKGDIVTWESQSGGVIKKKTGEIIAMISSGDGAMRLLPESAKKSHIKFDKDVSAWDRALVAVKTGKDNQLTHYYCPSVKVLAEQGNA